VLVAAEVKVALPAADNALAITLPLLSITVFPSSPNENPFIELKVVAIFSYI
jgi:hypothetical protein